MNNYACAFWPQEEHKRVIPILFWIYQSKIKKTGVAEAVVT